MFLHDLGLGQQVHKQPSFSKFLQHHESDILWKFQAVFLSLHREALVCDQGQEAVVTPFHAPKAAFFVKLLKSEAHALFVNDQEVIKNDN